jgi:hypothetical protein
MPRRMKGRGKFKDFLGKANNFLKKSQILSKLGNAYSKYGSNFGLPYTTQIGQAADVAKTMGYGRRRRVRRGGALRPAGARRYGSGLYPASGGSRRPMTW